MTGLWIALAYIAVIARAVRVCRLVELRRDAEPLPDALDDVVESNDIPWMHIEFNTSDQCWLQKHGMSDRILGI